jgi:signal transduction histidine kinase
MEVTDDGLGIDDQALSKSGSLGLLGIRERIGALAGDVFVRKNGACGTFLSVLVPVVAEAVARAS